MPSRINSKQKGASFERKICVRLSLWISRKTREDLFWRAAMSGGRATLLSRKGRGSAVVAQIGDISAIHELGHPFLRLFVVECKFYKELKLESMIYGNAAHVEEIWYKTLKMADANDRAPFIVARQNRRDELLWTTEAGLDLLRSSVPLGQELKCFATFPIHGIHVVHLRDVVLVCDPDVLRAMAAGMPEHTPVKPKLRNRVSEIPIHAPRRRFSEIIVAPKRRRFSEIQVIPRRRRRPHAENVSVVRRRLFSSV